MSLIRLNRSLIRVSGEGTISFLQGLVTQDLVAGRTSGVELMGSLFLNPKGRIISESIVKFADNGVLIDVPDSNADLIASMLSRHKLRHPIQIEKFDDFIVCADMNVGGDPRSPELPGRKYVRKGEEGVVDSVEGQRGYTKRRLLAGVAEGSDEITKDSIVPIFFNFDLLNCISFTKGCYTGQELVTRTLRRGIVRKRLFPIVKGETELKKGDSVCYKGERIGDLIVSDGEVGLAQLTLPSSTGMNDLGQIRDTIKEIDMDQFSVGNEKVKLVVPQYMR